VINSQDSKNIYLQRTHTLSGGRGDVRAWNIYSWLIFELEVLCVLGKWNQNQNRRASKRRLNARTRWNNKDGWVDQSMWMNLTSGHVWAWDGRDSPNLGGCRIRAAAAVKFQMNWTVPYTGTDLLCLSGCIYPDSLRETIAPSISWADIDVPCSVAYGYGGQA
jgi:hypothetical protein